MSDASTSVVSADLDMSAFISAANFLNAGVEIDLDIYIDTETLTIGGVLIDKFVFDQTYDFFPQYDSTHPGLDECGQSQPHVNTCSNGALD